MPSALADGVADRLAVDAETFRAGAEEEAEFIKSELRAGTFDNPQAIVGLEYEFHAAAGERWTDRTDPAGRQPVGGALARVPRRLLEYIGFEKELGLHNAEMTTSPQPCNRFGLAAQEAEVLARLSAAQDAMAVEGLRLVSDAIWTVPPVGETAREYLTDSVVDGGVRLATNMSESTRYHAFAGADLEPGMSVDLPHVHLQADTVMPASLTTSIQPHYQVAAAADLPTHFRYALRIAGPLLALGVNSPFVPPDLYDADAAPEAVLADGHDEHRIAVFESVLNPADGPAKVRFPRDLATVEEAVDRVARDPPMVPAEVEAGGRFDDEFARFGHKHGTYWRWVRPVFEGATRSAANARIEFRPIPGQPTVRDVVGFQAAFAGLLTSLVVREHPVARLDWETARENFYRAARDGPDADLRWLANDGQETTDAAAIFDDIFAHAADGLALRGLDDRETERYHRPLRERVERGTTPADWKRRQVRRRLADGDGLEAAIYGMQRAYLDRQAETLLDGTFADWLD